MTDPDPRPERLPEACLRQAMAIVESEGPERLSLREVARRLGVSHQAPYKHFPSRDHILAALVARVFADFAGHLEARPRHADPAADLGALGRAYLAYARAHPVAYRLMFATPLPDPTAHPEMMRQARHAFALLRDALGRLPPPSGGAPRAVDPDALFVWSTVHGLASLLQSRAFATLDLPGDAADLAADATLARIGAALAAPPREPPD